MMARCGQQTMSRPWNVTQPYRLGAPMTNPPASAIERYLEELYRWNRRINLTTVPKEQAWERHVRESERVLDAFDIPTRARLIDVGTGAGIPGMVIATLRPDLIVTLLDSDRRKCAFLHHV